MVCGFYGTIEKSVNDLEREGFVPISMSQGDIDDKLAVCVLMHKKE